MCYIDMVKGETESVEYQYPGSCILSSTGDARGFLFVIERCYNLGIHTPGELSNLLETLAKHIIARIICRDAVGVSLIHAWKQTSEVKCTRWLCSILSYSKCNMLSPADLSQEALWLQPWRTTEGSIKYWNSIEVCVSISRWLMWSVMQMIQPSCFVGRRTLTVRSSDRTLDDSIFPVLISTPERGMW